MNKNAAIAIAVVAALLGIIGAWILTRPSNPGPDRGEKTEKVAQKAPPKGVAVEVDTPARPRTVQKEDGGMAFGEAVCQKMTQCDCQKRSALTCAHDWNWVLAEDYDTAKCMLDLPCEDLCRQNTHPQDVACLVSVDEIFERRTGKAPWKNGGPEVPGIVTGKQ